MRFLLFVGLYLFINLCIGIGLARWIKRERPVEYAIYIDKLWWAMVILLGIPVCLIVFFERK